MWRSRVANRIPLRSVLRDAAALTCLIVATSVGLRLAVDWTRPLLLNFGPNDDTYVRGFRKGWEQEPSRDAEPKTRFHWTLLSSTVTLPVRLEGEAFRLRLRLRRHFIDSAQVRLIVEGRPVHSFEIKADPKVAYRVEAVPLPRLEGRHAFLLAIECSTRNPRSEGVALDWMEIVRDRSAARVHVMRTLVLALLGVVVAAYVFPRAAGAPLSLATAHSALLAAGALAGIGWDLIAAERILCEGVPAYLGVGLLTLLLLRTARVAGALGVPSDSAAGGLLVLVSLALVVRLIMLLHPQFYYPDVKIHGIFVWKLVRLGYLQFLGEFTERQFEYSLGLQEWNGHWYAFPYPPAFYVLAAPLVQWARYSYDLAVSVLAAAVNAIEVVLVFALARRLTTSLGTALGAAGVHVLLPLFLARLGQAYFPAVVGHAVDLLVILYLISRLDRLDKPRVVASLAALMALALLTYTTSLLTFAVLLPVFLAAELALNRTPRARRRQLGLAVAGSLGILLAVAVFYGRYIPVFIDMQNGIPMAGEEIKIEKDRQRPVDDAEVEPDEQDPDAGPEFDLVRGFRKAGRRLYRFYGAFAPLVLLGVLMLVRGLHGSRRRFVVVWATTYVLLNLASGALPGPNLVRYNKDLEIVAPLCCVALAGVGSWLWQRSKGVAVIYGVAYVALGLSRAVLYLTEKFVLVR